MLAESASLTSCSNTSQEEPTVASDQLFIAECEAIIARLKAALRHADLALVSVLAPALETRRQRLASSLKSGDRHLADRVRRSLEDLQRLSRASLSGLSTARWRLEILLDRNTSLNTYDAEGRVSALGRETSSVERRG